MRDVDIAIPFVLVSLSLMIRYCTKTAKPTDEMFLLVGCLIEIWTKTSAQALNAEGYRCKTLRFSASKSLYLRNGARHRYSYRELRNRVL